MIVVGLLLTLSLGGSNGQNDLMIITLHLDWEVSYLRMIIYQKDTRYQNRFINPTEEY